MLKRSTTSGRAVAARLPHKQEVAGSSPVPATIRGPADAPFRIVARHSDASLAASEVCDFLGVSARRLLQLRNVNGSADRIRSTAGSGTRGQRWSPYDALRLAVVRSLGLPPTDRLRAYREMADCLDLERLLVSTDSQYLVMWRAPDGQPILRMSAEPLREMQEANSVASWLVNLSEFRSRFLQSFAVHAVRGSG